jgi:hypothetical protein
MVAETMKERTKTNEAHYFTPTNQKAAVSHNDE